MPVMRLALKIHPDTTSAAVTGIEVDVTRPRPGCMALVYAVTGKIDDLRIASRTEPARADELWKHTCFETFIRAAGGADYYEFNFSPSTQWAAYRFSGYRAAMHIADEIQASPDRNRTRRRRATHCRPRSNWIGQNCLDSEKWQLGLSAVIEELNGRKSYWALAHPPGKPDFHHSDCFAYEFS